MRFIMVTLLHPHTLKLVRRIMPSEEMFNAFMDQLEEAGVAACVTEVAIVDTTLSDLFCVDTV